MNEKAANSNAVAPNVQATASERYEVLDAYRALAALIVVAYHYFYRWTDLNGEDIALPVVPFVSDNPLVASGALGVEFFFIISGFVIPLTLASTTGLIEFVVKRFARLFPAMLFCSVVTFIGVSLLGVAPFSNVSAVDFLPSLSFVSPYVWNTLTGLDTDWISGVYWSLFVEIKFYAIAAALFFLSREKLLRNYLAFSVALLFVYWIARAGEVRVLVNFLQIVTYPTYAGFFLAGIGFYALFKGNDAERGLALASVALGFAYSIAAYSVLLADGFTLTRPIILVVFFVLFVLFVTRSALVAPLGNAWLAKIGAASYSLYLFHEPVGVSLLYLANGVYGSPLWTFAMIVAMVGVSILIYDRVETPGRRLVMRLYKGRR